MTLLLDLGHTRAKLGEERDGQIFRLGVAPISGISRLHQTLRERQDQEETLYAVSTMRGDAGDELRAGVEEAWGGPVSWADPEKVRGDISLHYAQPETFGADRLLAMQAARQRTHSSLIIVDAGSAIAVDGLTEDNEHCGGWIVPGYLRQKEGLAMLYAATQAPSVSPRITAHTGTDEAVESGIWKLLSGGIDSMCTRLREDVLGGHALVMLTGGDAEKLQVWCHTPMIAAPDLVLEGLALCAHE
ncbi:MAG: type III pantothenate kinase [Gammaproteobacteria bacterium]|nr:type III pantothenate kinase [Gammaproteobacteria bacterium]